MAYWTFSDVFEEQGVVKMPFYGGYGLIAERGIPKAAYNAFALLHLLGSERLSLEAPWALATKRADGSLAIAAWNYNNVHAHVLQPGGAFNLEPEIDWMATFLWRGWIAITDLRSRPGNRWDVRDSRRANRFVFCTVRPNCPHPKSARSTPVRPSCCISRHRRWRSSKLFATKKWIMKHDARPMHDINDRLPIVPHESLGADCCGCLVVRVHV